MAAAIDGKVLPNATNREDKRLVEVLHYISAFARAQGEDFAAEMLSNAAVALDEYRAGQRLATPAEGSGWALVPVPNRPGDAA